MGILIAILFFGILVLVHEFGHFIVAKWSGVRVDEFAIGFPPRVASFKRGETRYSLNALPIGGYVLMPGENGQLTDDQGNIDPRSFAVQPAWKRAAILVAGVTMNMILAWVVYILIFAVIGAPNPSIPVIAEVVSGSPAQAAGLSSGDRILAINGQATHSVNDVHNDILSAVAADKTNNKTVPIQITLGHRGQDITKTVNALRNPPSGQGNVGIGIGELFQPVPWYTLPFQGLQQIGQNFSDEGTAIHEILTGLIKPGNAFAGPVGIVNYTSQAANAAPTQGYANLFGLLALLSWNLAIVNILPIPGLDGGRLLILLIEVVRRGKRLAPEREALVNLAGMVFLLSLIAVLTINDVSHIISGH
jgi:regulator of sigma E protease